MVHNCTRGTAGAEILDIASMPSKPSASIWGTVFTTVGLSMPGSFTAQMTESTLPVPLSQRPSPQRICSESDDLLGETGWQLSRDREKSFRMAQRPAGAAPFRSIPASTPSPPPTRSPTTSARRSPTGIRVEV